MLIIDPDNGTVVTTVGLAGRPAWSPDGRRLASLDNSDGAVRVADVATGQVRTVAELHIPAFTGDSCGTSGVVSWSPDGTALLVTSVDFAASGRRSVSVLRVDQPGQATLYEQQAADTANVGARWLNNGDVMIVAVATSGNITVQRANPWGAWPPQPQTLAIPPQPHIGEPAISPAGDHIAIPVYGPPPPAPTPGDHTPGSGVPSGAVMTVDVATGRTDTIARYAADVVVFSPDGRHLGFVGADSELVVVPVGSTAPSFTASFTALAVSWSPDGLSVAPVHGGTILRLDLATGNVHDLTGSHAGGDWVTEWEPA
jgi:WD40 repeat protein